MFPLIHLSQVINFSVLLLAFMLIIIIQIYYKKGLGAIVTRSTVIAIGKGVVTRYEFLLSEFGGYISLTSHWAESILHRMNFC